MKRLDARKYDLFAHLVAESACRTDRRRGMSGVALCGVHCTFAYHGRTDDPGIHEECRRLWGGVERQGKLWE